MLVILTERSPFGECSNCQSEWDSELVNEYEFKFCPYCGDKREHMGVYVYEDEEAFLRVEKVILAKKIDPKRGLSNEKKILIPLLYQELRR